MRIVKRLENNFTSISNEILNSNLISLKAKGLYSYMLSKPDNWNFTIESISNQLKEGQRAVKSAIKELEISGLLERRFKRPVKGSDGNWSSSNEYMIFDKISDSAFCNPKVIKKEKYIKSKNSKHCSLLYFDHLRVSGKIKERLSKK